ncbi:MAG: magnesium transporter [Archaeoglobaceae archaeon]
MMENYPYLLIILPGLMGLRGNIFGSLCSRLSTALYLGSSEPSFRDSYVYKNAFFSIWASVVPLIVLLIVGFLKIRDLDGFIASIQILIPSAILIGIFLSFSSVLIVITAFKRSVDPDSISGPMITSIADLVTIPSLVIFIQFFESGMIIPIMIFSLILLAIFILFSLGSEYRKIRLEVISIVTILAIFQSFTGSFLEEFSKIVYLSFFMSFAYPAIIDTLGNYGTIIVARTSTKLNLGEIESRNLKEILSDLKAILPTSLLIFPFISFAPILLSAFFFDVMIFNPIPMTIFFLSFPVIVFFIIAMAFYLALLLQTFKIDPDNGGIPLVTTLADLVGTIYAVAVALIFISI